MKLFLSKIFHHHNPRHLHFDGQLKLALHQPGLLGTQRIAIKFRNFVSFYDLHIRDNNSQIYLEHVRTLRITNVDGRETRLDDNPSQELRRQFGELQKRVRALNHYTRYKFVNLTSHFFTISVQWNSEEA